MVPNGILSEVSQAGRGADREVEVLRRCCLADSFSTQEPFGMNSALPSAQAVCDWMWSRPGRALEDVALLVELVVGLEGRLDRRVLPGVRLQVVDRRSTSRAADLGDERVEAEGEVVRVLARVRPAGDALLLRLRAEREHVVPGLRVLRVELRPECLWSTRRRRPCTRSRGSRPARRRTGPSRRHRGAACRGPSCPGRRWRGRRAAA